MTYREVIAKMKSELKSLALKIKIGKSGRKPANFNDSNSIQYTDLESNRYAFRHLHIVYCEMRGRSRDEIEQPARDNQPSAYKITTYHEQYSNMVTS